jgi:hypothetical protein
MNERTLEARPGRLEAVRREADRQVIHPFILGCTVFDEPHGFVPANPSASPSMDTT